MNNSFLKLSVIVPNYNSGHTLEETLVSILNQNYPNLELIIIDGASTDNSLDIIVKYKNHIAISISEKDYGQADAINKGLQLATGDYVAFLNADDLFLPNFLFKINKLASKSKVDFIFGDTLIGSNLNSSIPIRNSLKTLDLDKLLLFFFNLKFIIPSQSVWIRRSFLEKTSLMQLDKNLYYCMDLDWYCKIAEHHPTVYKLKEIYSFFRVTTGTKTSSNAGKMKLEAISVAHKYLPNLPIRKKEVWYKYRLLDFTIRRIYVGKLSNNLLLHFWLYTKLGYRYFLDRRTLGLIKSIIIKK